MRRSLVTILSCLAAGAMPASTALAQSSPAASSFAQLTGERGCILQAGINLDPDEYDLPAGCGRASGLVRARGIAMSPDDKQVYVVSGGTPFGGSSAVVTFQRSSSDGALSFSSCVSDSGGDGRAGS